jgi:hypothetical protein
MRNFIATAFLLAIFALSMFIPTYSQTKGREKEQKVLADIPQHLRATLIERLNSYVEYERTQRYEKLYDLLWEYVVNPNDRSRSAYVDASKKTVAKGYRSILLEFKPTGTIDLSRNDEGIVSYDIWGKAKVNSEGEIYEKDAAIEARWMNGEWYFSGVADVIID